MNGIVGAKTYMKDNIKNLRENLSFRSFLMLFLGIVLFIANIVLFFLASKYAFRYRDIINVVPFFIMGMIGIIASGVLIFCLTISLALPPEKEAKTASKKLEKSGSLLNDALHSTGKERRKKLAVAIITYLLIWGVGLGVVGYYIGEEVKYANYPSIEATVVELNYAGDGSQSVYEYEVDGKIYKKQGHLESSGAATPNIGDKLVIKYNPDNPEIVYLKGENMFFLLFGSFFLFVGVFLVVNELFCKGLIKTDLLVAFITLGLSVILFLAAFTTKSYSGIIQFFGDNLWLFFGLMFTNVGLLELFHPIVWLGYKKK